MIRVIAWLMFAVWLPPVAVAADQQLEKGKLLVATELVRGDLFTQTVVLLLEYEETGAMGLVINRPTEFEAGELLADLEAVSDYSGPIFWGGPVQMNSVATLLQTDTPPEGAETILDSIHLVPIGDWLEDAPTDPGSLRFFIGYAGWAPGQLDREMALGSWLVVPATDEHIFAEDPGALWGRLTPPRQHRVRLVDVAPGRD